jgi:hypothetical protein
MNSEQPIRMTGLEFNSKYTSPLWLETQLDCHLTSKYGGRKEQTILDGNNYHGTTQVYTDGHSLEGIPILLNINQTPLVNEFNFNFYLWDIKIPDNAIVQVYRNMVYTRQFQASNRRSVFDLTETQLHDLINANPDNLKWIDSQQFRDLGGCQVQLQILEPKTISQDTTSWKGRIRAFGFDF